MEVYSPAEDSYFFTDFLKKYLSKQKNRDIRHLDMGTATGLLPETVSKFIEKENIIAADINQDAVEIARKKGFKAIKSNLFENIKGKFDIITFNAPYLPKDEREPGDSQVVTTGGKKGDEISVRFLKQAKRHIKKDGKIFLLISSLTPMDRIKKFSPKIVARKKIFMEELLILEIS